MFMQVLYPAMLTERSAAQSQAGKSGVNRDTAIRSVLHFLKPPNRVTFHERTGKYLKINIRFNRYHLKGPNHGIQKHKAHLAATGAGDNQPAVIVNAEFIGEWQSDPPSGAGESQIRYRQQESGYLSFGKKYHPV